MTAIYTRDEMIRLLDKAIERDDHQAASQIRAMLSGEFKIDPVGGSGPIEVDGPHTQ